MESFSVGVAAIILLVLGWVIFKFFFRLLKHFIMAVVLAVILAVVWYQPWTWIAPPKDPNLGKFAYITGTDRFIGVVVGFDSNTNQWIVEKSNVKMKYAKNRVDLKDN